MSSSLIKAPFGWPGAKSKSLKNILPKLPYKKRYVEPFGGTGVVLLNRQRSNNECFNDAHSGLTAFYLCLQDKEKSEQLECLINETCHSREFWMWCKATWESVKDVDRAFRWYYMTKYSFGQMGRNFGRSTGNSNRDSGKLIRALPLFKMVHFRMQQVTIENQDWSSILESYSSKDTVFYIDPPYLDTSVGCYDHTMTDKDHEHLLDMVFACEGFFVVSGYASELYDNHPWDERHTWSTKSYVGGNAVTESNHKTEGAYTDTEEVLWIKK